MIVKEPTIHSEPGPVFSEASERAAYTTTERQLSETALITLQEINPGAVRRSASTSQPEVVALRLLDYLSSRKGYIRRKGPSFRTKSFYMQTLPKLSKAIEAGKPIKLTTLCLCPTLANRRFAGESPYPHMAAYIAFDNLQKIIQGARAVYEPGIEFTLGYEGVLFRSLYFHNDVVVRNSHNIFNEFNELVHANNAAAQTDNPIRIVDATWMIEQTFGSMQQFDKSVESQKPHAPEEEIAEWKHWYRQTVSSHYFPSETARERFIDDRARWRWAVLRHKLNGGPRGLGFMGFNDEVIPFTPGGRRTNMIALQMVPLNPYLPHQRVITYDPEEKRWRMMAYEDLAADEALYRPRYVKPYTYPLYYKKITQ